MVLSDSQSIVPTILGLAINIDFNMSLGISPVLYISFSRWVTASIPISSSGSISSMLIMSGPVAFPVFIFFIAYLTSSINIEGPSEFLSMILTFGLSSSYSSLIYSDHLSSTLSFSEMMCPSSDFIQLLLEFDFFYCVY